ncbi:hypothetical protein C0W42_18470 [Photobacterium kishitanii]|uniref:DUF2861 family protein n=1 Tax=Photobacterium kishitanii TaxID=318456 RepID=UPI000D172F50|nr:DUF2861 family protein [Photobacterium kishitanii]PSU86952.1 hypothetical protein C0W42_18470 [Photobacterium kishitanii]
MNRRIFLAIASLVLPIPGHAALFANSLLQHAYQATLNNQPQLAWQELTLVLNQHRIDSHYWLPIKNELLTQTDCGIKLASTRITDAQFHLSLIKRSGFVSQGYQFRLATENNSEPQRVALISPEGDVLLSDDFIAYNGYQELESDELLHKPAQGVFTLVVGENKLSLLLAFPNDDSWVSQLNQSNQMRVQVNLPKHISSCPQAVANWQWFDKNYNLINGKIPFNHSLEPLPDDGKVKAQAKFLSASVELFEYQQGIRIEYIQRLAIPYQQNGDI